MKIERKPKFLPAQRAKRGLRHLYHLLGFTRRPRWEAASAVLKQNIVAARRANDDASAAKWAVVKAQLKKVLYRTCPRCRCAIRAVNRECRMCRDWSIRRSAPSKA